MIGHIEIMYVRCLPVENRFLSIRDTEESNLIGLVDS